MELTNVTAKLSDLGLARWFNARRNFDDESMTMSVAGTAAYMAPEIRDAYEGRAEAAGYNSSADVYSAGLIAFVLFKRKLPSEILSPTHENVFILFAFL